MNRILMIGLTESEGGSQRHILELRKRIDCDVATSTDTKATFFSNIRFAIVVYFWSLSLIFGKKKYDVIHIHENTLYGLAPLLCWRYKTVITIHGMRGFKFYDNKLFWFFFKNSLRFADKIIAVNKEDEAILNYEFYGKLYDKYYILNGGEEPSKITYIPNGVDTSIYKRINPKVEKKIVFIGRINPQKGIIYLLKAYSKIFTDYKLEIIGDINSHYARTLQSEFYEEGERIIWRGSIKDRKEIVRSLKSAYMIVLPSLWEGLPLTLFESLASERPVIVSDIPAFKSVINDEALFFKNKNPKDLRLKIYKLLLNKNMANSLGKKGKELAKQYDWDIIAKQTMEVYNG